MQPYIFPYIGYFCLVQASDIFIFLDDVHYKKKGWINRNKILINGSPYTFTVPIKAVSQHKLICDLKLHSFEEFKRTFIKQIEQSYKKSVNYIKCREYIDRVLSTETESVSKLAINSIKLFYEMLEIDKTFLESSKDFSETKNLRSSHRIIKINKILNGQNYINSMGGMALYNQKDFIENNIHLSFIESVEKSYEQKSSKNFQKKLSIIDVFMNNKDEEIKSLLNLYRIVKKDHI